jgi:hypothetical protein
MKKRLTALLIALILILAVALPALSQTVEEELAAYWEKADPLFAQIEELGTRQTEIYQQFGLSLDDDSGDEVLDDAQYGEYVKGLGVLTDEELKTLIDANAGIVKLSDEIDALTARYTASEDPAEQETIDSLIHYKQHQLEDTVKSVADLDDKVRVAEETNYVMGLKGLTDEARSELLAMYATQRDTEKQLDALDEGLSEAARDELYGEQG